MSSAKNRPDVCIILMTYNQGRFLNESIEALKKQTFQNFEIHLIDDGSDDGETPDILNNVRYAKISEKFIHIENKGTVKRQQEQYAIIDNKYIMILCADDILEPTFLEKTVAYMNKHPKCGAVGTNITMFYENAPDVVCKFDKTKMTLEHIAGKNHMLGSSLMRNKALKEADLSGGFTRYQDWDRWVSMLEAGWNLGLIEEPLFRYRQHCKSLSHTASIEDELLIRKKMIKKHHETYKKYYEQILLDVYRNLLEVQEGKDWLENQYFNLTNEIERLNKELDHCKKNNIKAKLKKILNKIKTITK